MKSKLLPSLAIFLGLVILVTILGVLFLPGYLVKDSLKTFAKNTPENELRTLARAILADREDLAKYDVFRGSRGERDAADYLNKLVPFSDDPTKGSLAIHPQLSKLMSTKDWMTVKFDFKGFAVDPSWMSQLANYDHWSPEVSNPRINISEKPELLSVPLPDYGLLMKWAKLRLIYGLQTNSMIDAVKDVRQLARLVFTNDNLVSAVATVAILRFETDFVVKNQTIIEGWSVIPTMTLDKARRFLYATSVYVDPRLPDDLYQEMSSTKVGECVMVAEGMNPNHLLRDDLSQYFQKEITRYAGTMKKSLETCRKGLHHLAWEDKNWKAISKLDSEIVGKEKLKDILLKNRELMAALVLEIASPNFLTQYHKSLK